MPDTTLGRASALVALFSTMSCAAGGTKATEPPFEVPVRAIGDGETPLAGVSLTIGKNAPVLTAADGIARLQLRGRLGDEIALSVSCPEGYAQPSAPLRFPLIRTAAGAPPLVRTIMCERGMRRVLAAIRVDLPARKTGSSSATLPITRFGHAIGATDTSGAAHVAIEGKPGEHVELTLDTSDRERRSLRPQSPTLSFVIPERDAMLSLDQTFEEDAPPAPPRRAVTKASRSRDASPSKLPSRI